MKKVRLILYDFWKSKWFNALLFCLITGCIVALSILVGNIKALNIKAFLYNSTFDDYSFASFSKTYSVGEVQADPLFEGAIFGQMTFTFEGLTTIISGEGGRRLRMNGIKKWFDGEVREEYAEALVNRDLAPRFEIGKTYDVKYDFKTTRKIKVIGYLDNNATLLRVDGSGYGEMFIQQGAMMICDDLPSEAKVFSFLLPSGANENKIYEKYAGGVRKIRSSYEDHLENEKSQLSMIFYLIFLGVATIVCVIFGSSMFKLNDEKKRNAVKFICGEDKKSIMLGEAIKILIMFVLPAILALFISMPFIKDGNKTDFSTYFISLGATFVIYVLTMSVSLIKKMRAKPLQSLKERA